MANKKITEVTTVNTINDADYLFVNQNQAIRQIKKSDIPKPTYTADEVGALPNTTIIPTTLPNPNALTFTGAATGSYDGSSPVEINIPEGGGTGVTVDNTLSVAGKAADAKATGDAINSLSEKIADKATVENGVVRVWKSATKEGGTDTLLYTIDLSSLNTGSGTGLSNTATSLLISILRNAIYESDQSAIITELETALKEGGSSGGNEPDVPVNPDKTYYSVLVTKTNCTVNSSATSIEEGGVYVAQITPDDGYTIETVTVTMGGKDITSTAYSDGSISISNVTGEIVVVATAIETPNDLVYSANWNYGKRQYSPTASQNNASFTSSDWIDVTKGQVITATLLESNVIDGTTYNWSSENTPFNVWFRDSSGSGVSPTVAPSSYMNLNNETYPSSQEVTVPDGAVSMCFCLSSGRTYFNSTTTAKVSCESLGGRPVWFSLVLSGGKA